MNASRRHAAMASVMFASFFSRATAQADPTADPNPAEVLFKEAVQLLEQRDFAAACPKLAQSFELDPVGGTALDLAFCYESQDRLASAIETYRAALHIAE